MSKKLTNRQRVFVQEYLTCWNASEAARRAGYTKKANVIGSELVANSSISAEIEKEMATRAMGKDEVLARLAAHARADLSHFLVQDVDETTIDLTTDEAKKHLHLIKKIRSKTRRGTRESGEEWEEHDTEIELHDAQAALVHIGRHLKLFTDKTEGGLDAETREMLREFFAPAA